MHGKSDWWLTYPSEKWWSESQLGWLFHAHMKWKIIQMFETTKQCVTLWLICPRQNRWDEHFVPSPCLHHGTQWHAARLVHLPWSARQTGDVLHAWLAWLTSPTRKTLYIYDICMYYKLLYYTLYINGLSYFCSLYGIFTNICPINDPNVGQYMSIYYTFSTWVSTKPY